MKSIYLWRIFKSHYCKAVFIASLILVFFLIPRKIFYGYYTILGIVFGIVTAATITCFVRNIKERAMAARASGASILGVIVIVLGFGALQACSVGAPVCGASIGAGIIALFFPGVAMNFLGKYSILIIVLSIFIQIAALYFMNCFKHVPKLIKGQKC